LIVGARLGEQRKLGILALIAPYLGERREELKTLLDHSTHRRQGHDCQGPVPPNPPLGEPRLDGAPLGVAPRSVHGEALAEPPVEPQRARGSDHQRNEGPGELASQASKAVLSDTILPHPAHGGSEQVRQQAPRLVCGQGGQEARGGQVLFRSLHVGSPDRERVRRRPATNGRRPGNGGAPSATATRGPGMRIHLAGGRGPAGRAWRGTHAPRQPRLPPRAPLPRPAPSATRRGRARTRSGRRPARGSGLATSPGVSRAPRAWTAGEPARRWVEAPRATTCAASGPPRRGRCRTAGSPPRREASADRAESPGRPGAARPSTPGASSRTG